MVAICYIDPISAIPTNKLLFVDKITCAKFQIDISKIDGLVRVYTDKWTISNRETALELCS